MNIIANRPAPIASRTAPWTWPKIAIPKLSPAQWLLSALAIGQGAALVYAGVILDGHADGVYFWLAIIRAVPGGIAASFAAAYSTHNIIRHGGKKAVAVGWVAIGLLVACSVVVTAICTVEPPVGLLRWIASTAYAIMIDAAVVAVAVTSGKLFVEPQPETATVPTKQPKEKVKQPETTEAPPVVAPIQPVPEEEIIVPGEINTVVVGKMLTDNPKTTNAQLAAKFTVSVSAVQKHPGIKAIRDRLKALHVQ